MRTQTTQNRVPFARALRSKLLRVFAVFGLVCALFIAAHPSPAHAATPTLNFQARLENSTGGIASDGNYNVEFNLYQGGTEAGGGTLKWTETRKFDGGPDNRVHVANGYLTVNLGSVTNFPGTINWDDDLFLTMNIGGTTTGTPSWDGEMNPRLKLTSVPYAFQAASAAQVTTSQGAYTGNLQFGTLTGNQAILLPDASGTVCLDDTVNNCGYLTGSAANGNYIQLQGTTPGTPQTGNFYVSGTGIAGTLQGGTSVLTPLLDTATAGVLNVGTTNATQINLNKNVVVSANFTVVNTGNVAFQRGNNFSLTGSQNDVNFGTGALFRLTGASTQTITGLAGGTDGRIITIINAAGQSATVSNNSGSSLAANRIITGTGSNLTLAAGASINLVYDSADNLWHVVGGSSGIGGGVYVTLQASTPGTADTGNLNISGTAVVNKLQVTAGTGAIDTATAGVLNIGTTNATQINLNQNVVVAAGKTLTLAGGNTAGRPVAPAEGTLYYDTSTHQLLRYNGTKWVSDNRTAITVAASDSSQADKDAADYQADGTDDQVQINQALTAAAGGTVYLFPGTYHAQQTNNGDATIYIPNYTTLTGAGSNNTLVALETLSGTGSDNLIENQDTVSGANVSIKNLSLDNAGAAGGTQNAIVFDTLQNLSRDSLSGISNFGWLQGDILDLDNTSLLNLSDNSLFGVVSLTNASNIVTASNNIFAGVVLDASTIQALQNNSILGSLSATNGSLLGTVTNNSLGTVSVDGSALGTFTGNDLIGSLSLNTVSYAQIDGNTFTNSGSYNSIDLTDSDNNSITNNKVKDASSTGYGIKVDAASDYNYIANNQLGGLGINDPTFFSSDNSYVAGDANDDYSIQPASGHTIQLLRATTITGGLTVASGNVAFQKGNNYSTTGSQNDVNFGTGAVFRLTGASTQTITGIAGGVDGRIMTLINAAGQAATLSNSSGSSTSTNQIITGTGGDLTLAAGASINLVYDSGSSRWRIVGGSSGIGGGVYVTLQGTTPGTADTGNLNISGAAIASKLQVTAGTGVIDTATAGVLNIGTTNATQINLNKDVVATTGNLTLTTATVTNDSLKVSVAAGGAAAFTGTLTNQDLTATRTWTLQNADGVLAVGTAGNSLFLTTTGATNITLPTTGTLCTTTSCGGAGSGYVQFAPVAVQTDGSNNNSIFINKTSGTGNILELQKATVDVFAISNNGDATFSQNVTVASGKYLTLTGSGTRPTPAEGMLYYDTTTKKLLIYSNGKWQADRSTATKIVGTSATGGASTAVASVDADGADYVNASNTAAQTVINSALSAVSGAGGGSVYLMEGTYIIDGTINVPSNVTLTGSGSKTIIKIKNTVSTTLNAITPAASGNNIVITNLAIDGNKANTTGNQYGINANSVGGSTTVGVKIDNVTASNFTATGILLSGAQSSVVSRVTANSNTTGIDLFNTSNSSVVDSTANSNTTGILVDSSSARNTISGNTANSNTQGIYLFNATSITVSGNTTNANTYGILVSGSTFNTVTANTANANTDTGITLTTSANSNTVSSNGVYNNTTAGIYLNVVSDNTVTGNTAVGGVNGIVVNVSTSNTVSANTTKSASSSGIAVSFSTNNTVSANNSTNNAIAGIYLSTSNTNSISNNTLTDNGGGTNNNSIVILGTGNSINDNIISDAAASGTNYAISVSLTSGATYVSNNYFSGTGTPSIYDPGTVVVYAGQTDTSGNYKIQPAGTISLLKDTNVTGFVNASAGFKFNGTAGSTTTCTSSNVLINAVIQGGIITGGTCSLPTAGNTLQTAYDNSSSPATILLADAKNFVVNAADTTTDPNILFNLQCTTSCGSNGRFAIQSASTDVLTVSPDGTITIGNGSNKVTFTGTGGSAFEPILSGSAQHTKTIKVAAEYAGATLDYLNDGSCSGTNSGTMTSGLDYTINTKIKNYYNWNVVSSISTTQCYDVVVQIPVPSDWSSWSGVPTIEAWGSSTSNASGAVDISGGDLSSDSAYGSNPITISSASTWQTTNLTALTNGKYTAGSTYVTMRIRMNAKSGDSFRIGTITLSYKSKY